jgi:large subunit ribosomal protein L15
MTFPITWSSSLLDSPLLVTLLSVSLIIFLSIDAYAFIPRSTGLYVPRSSSCTLQMKLFDWKRRTADETVLNDLDATLFTLDNLKHAPGSRHRKSRKGRGISAGQGATCGFGMRGQKSRGGNPTRPGFEGGQTALYRRLPKFVGRPTGPGHSKTIYNVISTDALESVAAGSSVNFDSLFESKLISKSKYDLHKIVMGKSPIASNLTVQAHGYTKSAREAIEAAGGKCELLSPTTNEVLVEE